LFYTFTKLFFKKIKFKGKGYYIYKNFRNTIALQFGYSHIKRLYFYFTFVKFLSKTSIILFGLNLKDISLLSKKLYSVRPINIFTGKGMRFTRQIIYRKTGKISSYR
jgi:ribosomal protein L6P/L9E